MKRRYLYLIIVLIAFGVSTVISVGSSIGFYEVNKERYLGESQHLAEVNEKLKQVANSTIQSLESYGTEWRIQELHTPAERQTEFQEYIDVVLWNEQAAEKIEGRVISQGDEQFIIVEYKARSLLSENCSKVVLKWSIDYRFIEQQEVYLDSQSYMDGISRWFVAQTIRVAAILEVILVAVAIIVVRRKK